MEAAEKVRVFPQILQLLEGPQTLAEAEAVVTAFLLLAVLEVLEL
jgi:hypothetical protein